MLHSYSGSAATLLSLAKRGAYFSFSASLTRPRAKRVHESLRTAPLDRILLETDAPDMQPFLHGKRDRRQPNEPVNMIYVLEKASEILGKSSEDIASITFANAKRFFRVEIP